MFGIPYISSPPGRSDRSITVTVCPVRFSRSAAASPEGPLPTTATVFPVRTAGTRGLIHPFANAASIRYSSLSRFVTPLSARLQAFSHRAGHTRPVNSGNGAVISSRPKASSSKPSSSRLFHSGIRLCSGHPKSDWQNGTPQFIQRDACRQRISVLCASCRSSKSSTRSASGRSGFSHRVYSINPAVLPISIPSRGSDPENKKQGREIVPKHPCLVGRNDTTTSDRRQ